MSNWRRTGFRRGCVYSITSIPQRVWTRPILNIVTTNSASTTEGVGYVSLKATIACWFGGLKKSSSVGLEQREQQNMHHTLMVSHPLTSLRDPTAEPEFITESCCGPVVS